MVDLLDYTYQGPHENNGLSADHRLSCVEVQNFKDGFLKLSLNSLFKREKGLRHFFRKPT